MSARIIDSVPYINDKPAIHDPLPPDDLWIGTLSDYRCPECNARLSAEHQICMNACHLNVAQFRRFMDDMHAIKATVDAQIKRTQKGESG